MIGGRALALALTVWSLPLVTAAQGPSAPSREAIAEARQRVDRGARFFDEGRYEAALAEFRQANEIAPNYRVLYNIARVYEETGDAVRAVDEFERYLEQGAAAVPASRRREVEGRLSEQRGRIGTLRIEADVDGAEVLVDDIAITDESGAPRRTPLTEPVRLTAGSYVVTARTAHHESSARAVELAGGVETTVALELTPITSNRATLRVLTTLADVEVTVNDEPIGTTPTGSVEVAPGAVVVVGRRNGYVTARRELTLQPGSERDVELSLSIDPGAPASTLGRLRLELPDASRTLTVDGLPVDSAALSLPVGPHTVDVDVADRQSLRIEVDVPRGEELTVAPQLEWTPEARNERVSDAGTLRTVGWAATLSGAALVLGLAPVFVVSQSRLSDLDDDLAWLEELHINCGGNPSFSAECRDPDGTPRNHQDIVNEEVAPAVRDWELAEVLSAIGASLGLAALATGIVLLATAPSEADIDADARASGLRLWLAIDDRGAMLRGGF